MTIGAIDLNENGFRAIDVRGAMDMPSRTDEPYHDWGDEWEMDTDIANHSYSSRKFTVSALYDSRIGNLTWLQASDLIKDEMENGSIVGITKNGSGGLLMERISNLLSITWRGKRTDQVRRMDVEMIEVDPKFYFFDYPDEGSFEYELTTVHGSHSFHSFGVIPTGVNGIYDFQGYLPKNIRTLNANQEYSTREARQYVTVSCIMGNGQGNDKLDWVTMSKLARFQDRLRLIPGGSVILGGKFFDNVVVEDGFSVKHLRNGVATFDIKFTILP